MITLLFLSLVSGFVMAPFKKLNAIAPVEKGSLHALQSLPQVWLKPCCQGPLEWKTRMRQCFSKGVVQCLNR